MKLFKTSLMILSATLACFAASYGSARMANVDESTFYLADLLRRYLYASGDMKEVNFEKKFGSTTLREIAIETNHLDVTIARTDGEEIAVRLAGFVDKGQPDDAGLEIHEANATLSVGSKTTLSDTSTGIKLRPKGFQAGLVIAVPKQITELSVKTVHGDVTVDPVTVEKLTVMTSSGDVTAAHDVSIGQLDVITSSGDISLSITRAEKVSVATSSGETELTFWESDPVASVESSSGDVQMYFSSNPNFKLVAQTESGTIETTPSLLGADFEGTTLGTTLGAGKGAISVKTESGDIELRARY